jgi:hypothetical protein
MNCCVTGGSAALRQRAWHDGGGALQVRDQATPRLTQREKRKDRRAGGQSEYRDDFDFDIAIDFDFDIDFGIDIDFDFDFDNTMSKVLFRFLFIGLYVTNTAHAWLGKELQY